MAKAAKKAARQSPANPVKKKPARNVKAPAKDVASTGGNLPAKKASSRTQEADTKKTASPTKNAPAKKAATPAKKAAAKKVVFTTVDDCIQAQDTVTAATLTALRKVMLAADKSVGEQVKWNSPAYYYTGEMKAFDPKEYKRDIAVVNLNRKEYVLLIFPTGARIKNSSGLLEGNYPDGRRMVKIVDEKDLKEKEQALQQIVRDWLKGVE